MQNEHLSTKKEKIDFLLSNCKNESEEDLVFALLEKLVFINNSKYNMLLDVMVDYIIDLNLDYDKTQLVATCMDDEADSSQLVLQSIKHKFVGKGIGNILTVNNFNKCIKYYHQGKTNIIVLDELIGSGKTVRNRIKVFKERINFNEEYNFKFVFVAGVDFYVKQLIKEGIDVFCSYPLKRGISDNFLGDELKKYSNAMLELELTLAPKINEKELSDYSFGYGGAEALYTAEDCLSNTPNSVFPIFWWKIDKSLKNRNTLLNRYEIGL